jgi:phage nucleotide-binding protein
VAELKFISAADIPDTWGLNAVIYGPPGSGKTTFAGMAEDYEPARDVLIIDIEGGTRSLADRKHVKVVRPGDWSEMRDIYEYLEAGEHSFKTIVIDSLTEAQKFNLKHIMKANAGQDMPGIQDYGKSNEQITAMVRAYRHFSQTRGWNVVFTALAKDVKDESTGVVKTMPSLTPAAVDGVCGAVDLVGYLTTETDLGGKTKRVLALASTSYFIAKVRQPLSNQVVPNRIEDPSFGTLLEKLSGLGGVDKKK